MVGCLACFPRAVPEPCSASGAAKPALRCLARILSHSREKERVFTKFLCVAHCCREKRLRRSHRRQPQVRPARIARPSRSAVRKAPCMAAKCPCRRRWHGARHLGWEGRCEGHLRSRIRHWLCCCVFDRYSQQSASRAAHITLRRRAHCAVGMRHTGAILSRRHAARTELAKRSMHRIGEVVVPVTESESSGEQYIGDEYEM